MQIVVIGAAGRTGAHIVQQAVQAVQAQHHVSALVRDTTRYHPPTDGGKSPADRVPNLCGRNS